MVRIRQLSIVLGAALAVVLLSATPALAHTSLKRSDPAEGARLTAAPTTVSLTFGEAVRLPAQPLRVTGPSGAAWTVDKATISGATLTFPVTATGPSGAYTLDWSVVADDGDTIKGAVHFTLAAPITPAVPTPSPTPTVPTPTVPTPTVPTPTVPTPAVPTPSPDPAATSRAAPETAVAVTFYTEPPPGSGGVPGWVWVVGGVVVVGALVGLLALRSRRRRPIDDQHG